MIAGWRWLQCQAWGYNPWYIFYALTLFPFTSPFPFFNGQIISLRDLSVLFLDPGEGVTVEDEVVVINSIVLPYKTLDVSVQDEIIL